MTSLAEGPVAEDLWPLPSLDQAAHAPSRAGRETAPKCYACLGTGARRCRRPSSPGMSQDGLGRQGCERPGSKQPVPRGPAVASLGRGLLVSPSRTPPSPHPRQALRPRPASGAQNITYCLEGLGGPIRAPTWYTQRPRPKPPITETCPALPEDTEAQRGQARLQVTLRGVGPLHWAPLPGGLWALSPCPASTTARPPAAPHLFALLVRGEGMSGSGAHGGAEGAAGALMAQVALAGPGLGGAQQLRVELAVGRGRCGREDQCLQGCHLRLQHVDLAGVRWTSTLVQG